MRLLAQTTGRCDGMCDPDAWTGPRLTAEDIPDIEHIASRSPILYRSCRGRDKAHGDVTASGRLALVADAAARGVWQMEVA